MIQSLEEQYKYFKSKELPKLVEASGYKDSNLLIKLSKPFTTAGYYNDSKTEDLCVHVYIRDSHGDLESDLKLLYVPIVKGNEVLVQKRFVQPVAGYRESFGPLLYEKDGQIYLDLKTASTKPITFCTKGKDIKTIIHAYGSKAEIYVQSLIRILMDSSADSIIRKFGYNSIPDETYTADVDSIADILNEGSSEMPTKINKIRSYLLTSPAFVNTLEGLTRLCDFTSFVSCCVGCTLVESVHTPDKDFKVGTVLTAEDCDLLDNSYVQELRVNKDGILLHPMKFINLKFNILGETLAYDIPELDIKAHTAVTQDILQQLNDSAITKVSILSNNRIVDVERYSNFSQNTPEVFLSLISIYATNLHGELVNRYELSNRSVDSFCKVVEEHILANIQQFIDEMKNKSDDLTLINKFAASANAIKLHSFYDWYIGNKSRKKLLHEPDVNNLYSYHSKVPRVFADVASTSMTETMVEVQGHQYGRLDALEISESTSTSKAHTKTLCAKEISGKGLCTPYYVVNNGVVSDTIVYLSANEEVGKNIACYTEDFSSDMIDVLHDGDIITVHKSDVHYKESSPYQNMSLTHAVVTFPGHSDCKRITMSCNESKQAVPTVNSQRPIVNTGAESTVKAYVTCRDIIENISLSYNVDLSDVTSIKLINMYGDAKNRKLAFDINGSEYAYNYTAARKSSNGLLYGYKVVTNDTGVYGLDDYVLCHVDYSVNTTGDVKVFGCEESEDFRHGVSLVQNLKVVFKTFEHTTIDDSCTISSKLVGDDTLTHVNLISVTHAFKTKDRSILPGIGKYIKPGDIVFEDRLNNEVYRATRTEYGHVIHVEIRDSQKANGTYEAKAILANRAHIHVGDKLAGRHGNKSVIAKIVPEREMPYDPETGFTADIVLNPLGVPTRQNISQLLDVPLAYLGYLTNTHYVVAPYAKGDAEFVLSSLDDANIKPKRFIDGRTGQYFDRELNYGIISIQKLHHIVAGKLNFNNFSSPVNINTNMPPKGIKSSGGQAIGEMELWAIASTGCNAILQELYGCRSDNPKAVEQIREQLMYNEPANLSTGVAQNNQMIQALMIQNCIKFENNPDGSITMGALTDADVLSLAEYGISEVVQITSEHIFGSQKTASSRHHYKETWGFIPLNVPIVNPLFLGQKLNNILKRQTHSNYSDISTKLIIGELYLTPTFGLTEEPVGKTGLGALVDLVRHCNLGNLILNYFPVLPLFYRQPSSDSVHPFNKYLTKIIEANKRLADTVTFAAEKELYYYICNYIGVNTLRNKKLNEKYPNVLNMFQKLHHGNIRRQMYSKRVFSSLRSVIIPSDLAVTEIGIPYRAASMFEEMLVGRLTVDYPTLAEATPKLLKTLPYDENRFNKIANKFNLNITLKEYIDIITPILNTNVGIAGRQPTLHKYSIRGFHVKMTYNDAIEISPLVCTGYNADFDGDQMWFVPLYSEEAKREALEKMGSTQGIISPKDSSVTLQPGQDMILGLYLLTMFKDNTDTPSYNICDALSYIDLEKLKLDLITKTIKHWQLVNYNGYINTAGRIVFNSLIPGAFTDTVGKPSFEIDGLQSCKLLKYDGLVCKSGDSGKLGSSLPRVSMSTVCTDLYNEHGEQAHMFYDSLRRNGFFWCDNIGISISIWDYNDVSIDSDFSAEKEKALYEDFYAGLNSEEDLDAAMLTLYNSKSENHKEAEDYILQKLKRDSNLFIILDSGAKGKFDQILQVSGYVGSLKKNSKGSIKTPIKSNYLKGLTSFEAHQASRSTVINFAAAQKSTPDAGYSERKSVYMLNGMTITKENPLNSEDCGKSDWHIPIRWGKLKSMSIELSDSVVNLVTGFNVPTNSKYYEMTGKTVIGEDIKDLVKSGVLPYVITTDGHVIDFTGTFISSLINKPVSADSQYYKLTGQSKISTEIYALRKEGKLTEIEVDGVTIQFSNVIEIEYIVNDPTSHAILKNFNPDAPLNEHTIELLQKYKIHRVNTLSGDIVFTYYIHNSQRDLLLGRVARNLEFLRQADNSPVYVTTKSTLEYIEDEHIDNPEIRLMLNCENTKGVCRHCYGLDLGTNNLIEVGAEVGTTSAMTIAEPTSQGVISLVNTGGSTVVQRQPLSELYRRLLSGSVYKQKEPAMSPSHYSIGDGYIKREKVGNLVRVTIQGSGEQAEFSKLLPANYVLFEDGAYVPSNSLVFLEPATATNDLDDCLVMPEEVLGDLRKSLRWYTNYYVAYTNSGVSIQQKHLELLARAQMYKSESPRDEKSTILQHSGVIPYITFESCAASASELITNNDFKDVTFTNTTDSQLSNVMLSTNIYTKQNKSRNFIGRHTGRIIKTEIKNDTVEDSDIVKYEPVEKASTVINISDVFKERLSNAAMAASAVPVESIAPVEQTEVVTEDVEQEITEIRPSVSMVDTSSIFTADTIDEEEEETVNIETDSVVESESSSIGVNTSSIFAN